MNKVEKIILCVIAFLASATASAQSSGSEKFVVKAHANIGLGDAFSIESSLPGISSDASVNDYGIDFGWTFWQKSNHRLELNVGATYSSGSIDLGLSNLDYNYAAPECADMDGDSYIRYYELSYLNQKITSGRMNIPLYLSYAYRCNNRLGLHVDMGVSFGFKVSSKLSNLSGEGYSYGVYPQYDDLKMDESYLNDFGPKSYTTASGMTPKTNGFSASVLAGIGAEFRIYGPVAADLSFRYNKSLINLYKSELAVSQGFNAANAPVAYTVADGQQVKSLTDYLTTSKLSQISVNISIIYRF